MELFLSVQGHLCKFNRANVPEFKRDNSVYLSLLSILSSFVRNQDSGDCHVIFYHMFCTHVYTLANGCRTRVLPESQQMILSMLLSLRASFTLL